MNQMARVSIWRSIILHLFVKTLPSLEKLPLNLNQLRKASIYTCYPAATVVFSRRVTVWESLQVPWVRTQMSRY